MARMLVLVLVLVTAEASVLEQKANPIRKVVTMLQNMQKQVTAEGEKEEALFHKFMCYCKTGRGDLEASIADANNKISNLGSSVLELSAKKTQTEADLKQHQTDRSDAKEAMSQATALREKEATVFAKVESDAKTNIAALAKATAAIEKGATGFLQTSAASLLRTYAIEKADLTDAARQELLSFLSGNQEQGYVPQSGEIVGILKTMHDEMSAGLAEATAEEQSAIQTYEALMAAKKKEVAALTAQIEEELKRVGELGVQIAGMANDLEDTKDALAEDTKFLAELNAGCDKKAAQWEEIKSTRADELVALAETIKVLNDDDALELFKKTLPSASSFVQVDSGAAKALNIIRALRTQGAPRHELDFIEMALKGKHVGFEKVIKMIDAMVANLKVEQTDDDDKKSYCNSELDSTDDKKKGLEQSIADSETAIAELEGSISALRDELAALQAGIKALDKSVADATEQRKAEHAEYTELMANDGAAKDVLGWAKNRLNKFYNPKLYVAPPKRQLSEEDRIVVNMGGTLAATQPPAGIAGTGISAAFVQRRGAPAAPPATFGPYQKKSGEGGGVIAMIDLLVKDLDKEMTEAKVTETDAQADYEGLMAESAEKRAQDSKSVTDKAASQAAAEESLQAEQEAKAGTKKELAGTLETIHALHGECDWLLQYYDARKAARAGEVEALGNAKAVLNGADYSLVQVERHEMTPRESRKMMANAKAFSDAAKTHFSKKATKSEATKLEATNASANAQFADMSITSKAFMEVSLGPFSSAPEACDYCADSFTKTGQPPAGPVAPACVCMAYPADGGFTMFCATPASAAGFVKEKGGCRCNPRDMEHMAQTTCEPL